MHYWVGDWYFKAFCAREHITPLFESLHHRFLALRYIGFDKNGSKSLRVVADRNLILRDRLLGYHKAINRLYKSMKIARPWLNFWLSEATIAQRLSLPGSEEIAEIDDALWRQCRPCF